MAVPKGKAKWEKAGYVISIAVIVICLAGITISSMWRLSQIKRETAALELELAHWQGKLADIEEQIRLATEDETIERIAREKLGLVMPGETVYLPKSEEDL